MLFMILTIYHLFDLQICGIILQTLLFETGLSPEAIRTVLYGMGKQ